MTPADPKYLGKTFVIEDAAYTIERTSPRIDFKCYERQGLTAYKVDKTPDGKYDWNTLRPLNNRDDLKPGDKVLFDWPLGGMIELTVNDDGTRAESEGMSTALEFHPGFPEAGFPPEWTGSCFTNNKALLRVKFD